MSALLIVGCATGIGHATALRAAGAYDTLVLSDIDAAALVPLRDEITRQGTRCLAERTDIRDPSSVAALFESIAQTDITLDAAFNNVGVIGEVAPVHQSNLDAWHDCIATNLTGLYHLVRAEIALFTKAGRSARILNTSSEYGLHATDDVSAYVASKHGVVGLTRAAALEAAPAGVLVNTICPRAIYTGMTQRYAEEVEGYRERTESAIPMRRMGTAEEVAAFALWLLGPENTYVTGQALAIDGGAGA